MLKGPFDLSAEHPEDVDVEYKAAQGGDGKGAVPKSLWPTYSAMANTDGGVIVLGVEERLSPKSLMLTGIKEPEKVRQLLWDQLHDRAKTSACYLSGNDIEIIEYQNQRFITMTVPRADRTQRPIYIGGNPLTGTYRRRNASDYLCDEQSVKRMLADADTEPRDSMMFPTFNLDDLDRDSLANGFC